MPLLRTIGWLAGIMYSTIPAFWLLVHPRPERWSRYRRPLLVVGPVWFLMWVALAAITWPWRKLTLYNTWAGWLASLPLFAAGIFLYGQSQRHFTTDQVIGRSELHPDKHLQRLSTQGVRAHVRHPIYLAHLCELLAWSIGTGLAVLYALTAFGMLTGYFMIRAEERELEQRFGGQYREYRRRVPMLFPRICRGLHTEDTEARRG